MRLSSYFENINFLFNILQLFNISYVVSLQKMCLKNGGDNVQIRVTILRCFTSWITVHAIPLEAVPSSDVVAYALQVSLSDVERDTVSG